VPGVKLGFFLGGNMLPWELLLAGKFGFTEFDPEVTRKVGITVLQGGIARGTRLNLLDNWGGIRILLPLIPKLRLRVRVRVDRKANVTLSLSPRRAVDTFRRILNIYITNSRLDKVKTKHPRRAAPRRAAPTSA